MSSLSPYGEYVVTVSYRYQEAVSPLRTRATPSPPERTASTVRLVAKYRSQDLPVACRIQFAPRGLLKRERTVLPTLEYRWLAVSSTLWTRYRLEHLLAGKPLELPTLPLPTQAWNEVFESQSQAETTITQTLGTDALLLIDEEVWQAAVEPLYFVEDDQRLFGTSVHLRLVESCESGSAAQYFRLSEQEDAWAMRDGLRQYRRERQRKRFREENEGPAVEPGFQVVVERPDLLRREPRHELSNHFQPLYAQLRQKLRSLPAPISRADRCATVVAQARAKDTGLLDPADRRLTYVLPEHALHTNGEPLYNEKERAGLLGFLLAITPYPVSAYTGLCDADLARAYAAATKFR